MIGMTCSDYCFSKFSKMIALGAALSARVQDPLEPDASREHDALDLLQTCCISFNRAGLRMADMGVRGLRSASG
jgi:hypothetical protein